MQSRGGKRFPARRSDAAVLTNTLKSYVVGQRKLAGNAFDEIARSPFIRANPSTGHPIDEALRVDGSAFRGVKASGINLLERAI